MVGGGNGCLVFCEILDLMQMAGYGCRSIFFNVALFIMAFSKHVYDIARDSFVGLSNNK